jgi:hypothetical protein
MRVGDPGEQLRVRVGHHRGHRDVLLGTCAGSYRRDESSAVACRGDDVRFTSQVDDDIGPVREYLSGLLHDIAGPVDDRGRPEAARSSSVSASVPEVLATSRRPRRELNT